MKQSMIVASRHPTLVARIVAVYPLDGVHAGSALVAHQGRLLVIQDDAASVVWVDLFSRQTELVVLDGDGGQLEKKQKPDFEVAFSGPGRVITILGSGSARNRRRRAVLDVETNEVKLFDDTALFEALEQALGVIPNLEGGVIWQNQLRLFHRGAGSEKSAMVDLNLDVLQGAPPDVSSVKHVDLGLVAHGVPLHFTDATTYDEKLLYVAVAEDTPNAIDDGPVVGAVVGYLDELGATWTPLLEASGEMTTRKVEGLAVDSRSGKLFGVTDPDDPEKLAELLYIELAGA